MRLSTAVFGLGVAMMVSGCGDSGSDSVTEEQPAPIEIQIESTPSAAFKNAMVVSGTDSRGVRVELVIESGLAGEVTISEGLDLGLPDTYTPITNGFIEIALPADAQGRHLVSVASPAAFEVVATVDQANLEMSYTPFYSNKDGSIEFYVTLIDGSITFALMDVPEF